jgi:hypothetical protein
MPVCFTQVEEQRSALPALLCLTACTRVFTTGTPALPPVCVNLLCYTAVISAGQVFGTPRGHHRVKPFFDHVLSFSLADGCVWMRNYQVRF